MLQCKTELQRATKQYMLHLLSTHQGFLGAPVKFLEHKCWLPYIAIAGTEDKSGVLGSRLFSECLGSWHMLMNTHQNANTDSPQSLFSYTFLQSQSCMHIIPKSSWTEGLVRMLLHSTGIKRFKNFAKESLSHFSWCMLRFAELRTGFPKLKKYRTRSTALHRTMKICQGWPPFPAFVPRKSTKTNIASPAYSQLSEAARLWRPNQYDPQDMPFLLVFVLHDNPLRQLLHQAWTMTMAIQNAVGR